MKELIDAIERLRPHFERKAALEVDMDAGQERIRQEHEAWTQRNIVRNGIGQDIYQQWIAEMKEIARANRWDEYFPHTEALTADMVIVALPDRKLWDSRHPEHIYEWRDSPNESMRGHWCPDCPPLRPGDLGRKRGS